MLFAESNYVSGELLVYLEIESDFTRPHFKDLNSWRSNARILHISILWEKGLHYFARIHRKAKAGSERSAFNAFINAYKLVMHIPHICHFFTLPHFEVCKFYTQKCVNSR